MPRMSGRHALRCGLLALLPSLALLSACDPGSSTDKPAAQAAAPRDAALWQQLEQIERKGRARPASHDPVLHALQERTAPGSLERIEVLGLRGLLAAYAQDRTLVEQISQQLADWPVAATKLDARLAQAHVLGQYYKARGDFREARKSLALVGEKDFEQGSALARQRCLLVMASVLADVGEMDAAIAHALQALRLADGIGQPWRRALALSELANEYRRTDQGARARQAIADALQEAQHEPDPALLMILQQTRALVYQSDAGSNIQLSAQLEALKYAVEAGADSVRAQGQANLSDYYLNRGDYARALQIAQEALPLARATRNLNAEIVARLNTGMAQIALGKVAEGRAEARAAITLDEQQGATSYVAESWQELGRHLERAGDLIGAIEAHHEYRRLAEQVLREDTRKAVLDAQERYDAEQRAKEIELLNRDNSLKAEQIRARDLELQLWAALGGCVVLFATLMGMAYRRIRRTNADLASTNERLKVQSERDPLTGLANRRHFQAAIKELAAEGRLSGTVFLIDIDHFKRINDVQGHAAGDSVLIEVAQRLRSALREDDLVVRWGGEEFLIVVKARDPAFARTLAQRLLDLIAQPPVRHGTQSIAITASIGFASFPIEPHGLTLNWERAIDLVDTVMYMAKAHGRNKAYGIEQIAAADEAQLAQLSNRMEAAWHEGQVKLVALQGAAPPPTPAPATEELCA
ncbi:GGDEF domain-containing protein [Roseateles violae]|uniref:diguanylate cyclase n=1 Tax=Roseateles violae TaxID=3058042 RepID=A0ABT8DRR3_9BURK|nr:GGDEF domain-containing protein [Pelomonas sp. PFR6]MDN3918989.1 GGDEF domain-containing protein [Pelomonas sp. PFR6]